jgi:hypothetical protein
MNRGNDRVVGRAVRHSTGQPQPATATHHLRRQI